MAWHSRFLIFNVQLEKRAHNFLLLNASVRRPTEGVALWFVGRTSQMEHRLRGYVLLCGYTSFVSFNSFKSASMSYKTQKALIKFDSRFLSPPPPPIFSRKFEIYFIERRVASELQWSSYVEKKKSVVNERSAWPA